MQSILFVWINIHYISHTKNFNSYYTAVSPMPKQYIRKYKIAQYLIDIHLKYLSGLKATYLCIWDITKQITCHVSCLRRKNYSYEEDLFVCSVTHNPVYV